MPSRGHGTYAFRASALTNFVAGAFSSRIAANRAFEMPVVSKDVQDSLISVPDTETVGGLASSELTSKRNLAFRFSLIRQESRRHCT